MNFKPSPLRYLSIASLSLALAACDTPPTVVDQNFGLAVQNAQAQQRLLAPGTQQPVLSRCPPDRPATHCSLEQLRSRDGRGLRSAPTNADTDGASALAAVTRYQQTFQTLPAPVPVFNIGLGALSAP
jgi:hypothetical protein